MGSITVLGLGPSLALYKPDGSITVGVNDIWAKVKTDYIVCVDKPERFTPERLNVIQQSRPIKFITHLDDYKDRPDYETIELLPYFPSHVCQLDLIQYPKSLCSPFIACAVAFKYLHATEINVYGVDLTNHNHLDKESCERIKIHFRNLKIALVQRGCRLVIHGDGILINI